MVKKISTLALAALLCTPGLAKADKVADLEKQMAEMTQMFNAKMQAMQDEIAALKAKQAEAPAAAAPMAATESTAADWAKKISLSGRVRFRGYNLQNMWDFQDNNPPGPFDDNWDDFRLYGSLKATAKLTDDVTAVVQLTDQTWGEGTGVGDNVDNKIFLDNAYVEARKMFDLPVDMTFGRQNLIYGSGFVILDGQSQFASTSIYFDGVKLRLHLTDKMTLDALYMKDQENARGNGAHDDITLGGAYFTADNCPIVGKSEIYILNRNDESILKDIWMLGARVSNKMDNGIDYSLEAALQRGDAGNGLTGTVQDQDAWGTKLDAGYTFKSVSMAPRLYAGIVFMSGDDPNTNDYEGWDVFYGGWPQWGDLLAWKYLNLPGGGNILSSVYNYNAQSTVIGEAVYSNLQMWTLGASANLMQNLTGNVSYSNLTFDETFAGVDDDFGDYYQASFKYQYNKQLSFTLYGALLSPGDAFPQANQDNATEVYWETDFKF